MCVCVFVQWVGQYFLPNDTAASQWFNASFPDWALEMKQARAADRVWEYTLRMYTRGTTDNFGFNVYQYASVFVDEAASQQCHQFKVSLRA